MNLLFIGDMVGKGGRKAVRELVPGLRTEHRCSFCIANGENIAAGAGMTSKCIAEFCPDPVDVVTSGDHVWDQKGFDSEIPGLKNVLRPANFSRKQPGRGFGIFSNPLSGEIAVINLIGTVFMKNAIGCPFETVETILEKIPRTVKCVIVDFHAEATSEKAAMARFLDGKVTAVIGTHTHVQTADAKILPGGTAFISDVGMTGSENSILGREIPAVLRKFTTGLPTKLPVVDDGIRLDAVLISYNSESGKAEAIRPLSINAGF